MGDYKNNTYYSDKDKSLFVIPSYYTHGIGNAKTLVANINDVCDFLVGELGVKRDDIYCLEVVKSIRYKRKWVFWVNNFKGKLPDFVHRTDESMSNFIQ